MAHDVFISYASEDKLVADAVCGTLEGQRIRCWIAPRDVLAGVSYGGAITAAIRESRVMVLVFSQSSNASQHVTREVARAASEGLAILPFRIEDVGLSDDMEYFIGTSHWLDALSPPMERHLQSLAETVRLLLARMGQPGGMAAAEGAASGALAADRGVDALAGDGRVPSPAAEPAAPAADVPDVAGPLPPAGPVREVGRAAGPPAASAAGPPVPPRHEQSGDRLPSSDLLPEGVMAARQAPSGVGSGAAPAGGVAGGDGGTRLDAVRTGAGLAQRARSLGRAPLVAAAASVVALLVLAAVLLMLRGGGDDGAVVIWGPPVTVSTLAGSGDSGSADGPGRTAQFHTPVGVALSGEILWVADRGTHRIRRVDPSGAVRTVAELPRLTPAGGGEPTADLRGITAESDGDLFVTSGSRVLQVRPGGSVQVLAGDEEPGDRDGPVTVARFNNPQGLTVDEQGNVYVADTDNFRIRKIAPDGKVSTLAGSRQGSVDGRGTAAQFQNPYDVAVGPGGILYVADDYRVRTIAPDGTVTTLAGAPESGPPVDGTADAARFTSLRHIAVDRTGTIYVVDSNALRSIAPDGSVRTLAGKVGDSRARGVDGPGRRARFGWAGGLVVDANGVGYGADEGDDRIVKITVEQP